MSAKWRDNKESMPTIPAAASPQTNYGAYHGGNRGVEWNEVEKGARDHHVGTRVVGGKRIKVGADKGDHQAGVAVAARRPLEGHRQTVGGARQLVRPRRRHLLDPLHRLFGEV